MQSALTQAFSTLSPTTGEKALVQNPVPQQPYVMVKNEEESFIDRHPVLVVVGTLVFIAGVAIVGRKVYRNIVSGHEQKHTLDENDPASYAQRIKMAFENDDWGGTNMEELRSIFRDIPSKDFKTKVDTSYHKLFGKSLDEDLHSELQTTQYNEIMAIMAAKPDRTGKKGDTVSTDKQYQEWAKRLKAAFDKTYGPFPGTDEDAIKAVFTEIPTQAAFIGVGKAYQKIYANNLIDDLKSELEIWEYPDYMAIITSKP